MRPMATLRQGKPALAMLRAGVRTPTRLGPPGPRRVDACSQTRPVLPLTEIPQVRHPEPSGGVTVPARTPDFVLSALARSFASTVFTFFSN